MLIGKIGLWTLALLLQFAQVALDPRAECPNHKKKPGTISPKVQDCFKLMTSVIKETEMIWLSDQEKKCYIDMDHPERQKMFPETITPGNTVEYIRINDTHLDSNDGLELSLCKPHNDGRANPIKDCMSPIVNLSTLLFKGTVRRNIGTAGRRSICSYFKAEDETSNFTEFFINFIQDLPHWRQDVNGDIHKNC